MSKKQDRTEAKKRMQKYVGVGAAIGTGASFVLDRGRTAHLGALGGGMIGAGAGAIHNAGSYINKQMSNKKK